MKQIPLTRGLFVLVDDEDFDLLNQFNWYAQPSKNKNREIVFYAARRLPRRNGGKIILLHRWLLDAAAGMEVDHKNHNSLDCQRDNLRIATRQQNSWNIRKMRRTSTSKFKGVCRVSPACNSLNPWLAYIGSAYKATRKYLGYFSDEIEAAKAYDAAARREFGEFAVLNFP